MDLLKLQEVLNVRGMPKFCKVERVGGFCLVSLGDLGILLAIVLIGFTKIGIIRG